MIDLENKIERDKLIDDYFNKGYACDIREVYQAVVNTIADLEYANDEKIKEIEWLNKMLHEKFMKENTFLVENGIICAKNKEIERLNKKIEQYENPEDMTLMFMWCDEKAKDEIKRLNNIINELEKDMNRDDLSYVETQYVLDKIKELKGENNE